EQRFGRDGHNLTQALRWATSEIKVKDRKKRSFYLSAARSEVFNLVVSERIASQQAQQVLPGDILQLQGSHSWFQATENEDLNVLQTRLAQQDILLTAPLIGEQNVSATDLENRLVEKHQALLSLMAQERMKAARRPILMQAKDLQWTFVPEGLKIAFYLPAGSYATALVRELV
ncbi:tRNA pseudouridine(13) synthase TruD, partial [Ursidibacter maritimus]